MDLDKQKEKLNRLAEELESDISAEDITRESIVPDCAIGGISRMEAIQAQAVGNETRRRMTVRLANVRNALDRIERGTYGRCTRCGRSIPEARLAAVPEAPLCIECAAAATSAS